MCACRPVMSSEWNKFRTLGWFVLKVSRGFDKALYLFESSE